MAVPLEELKLKRTKVEASKDLSAADRDSALSLLDQAIGFSELSNELDRRSEILSQQIQSAPRRIENIHSELARPIERAEAVIAMVAKKDTVELQQRLQKELMLLLKQ